MKTWFEHAGCRSRAHCQACRQSAHFRATILAKGLVPERDFACPFGLDAPGAITTMLLLRKATRGRVVVRKKGCRSCAPQVHGG